MQTLPLGENLTLTLTVNQSAVKPPGSTFAATATGFPFWRPAHGAGGGRGRSSDRGGRSVGSLATPASLASSTSLLDWVVLTSRAPRAPCSQAPRCRERRRVSAFPFAPPLRRPARQRHHRVERDYPAAAGAAPRPASPPAGVTPLEASVTASSRTASSHPLRQTLPRRLTAPPVALRCRSTSSGSTRSSCCQTAQS